MKSLLIICDGMADRLMNNKTPLEAANTPNMDKLAKEGICGIMDTVKTGIRPGSDTAHLSLFGYDPYKVYPGRGPFEALGAGIKLKAGDVALRCNFASVIDEKVVDRRAGREEYGLDELAKAIDGMEIEINYDDKIDKTDNNKIKNYEELIIYTDGGADPNPGPAGFGIVIKDKSGNLIKEYNEYIGEATNNIAEYKAIIKALELAKELGAKKLTINSDNKLVINQVQGIWKIKHPHLKPLCQKVRNLQQDYGSNDFGSVNVSYNWIPREKNEHADRLAEESIKNQNKNSNSNSNSNSVKPANNKIKVIFKKCSGHRGVVVFRAPGLSANITDSDPEEEQVLIHKSEPLDDTAEAELTAEILNKFTKKAQHILSEHEINKKRIEMGILPANALLARGSGIMPEMISFEKKYKVRGAAIAGMDLIKGVCRSIGLDVIEVPGSTGHTDSNIKGKTDAAILALNDYDFVFLHIKGTDEASHDGNFEKKKEMIEKVDKEVIGTLLEMKELKNLNLIFTADHTTPVSLKKHTADPVPVVIYGDVRTDLVEKFGERTCARGDLGRICGKDLLNILFDLSDKQELFGA